MKSPPHHHFASFFKEQKDLQPFAYAVSRQLAQGSVCLDLKEKPSADELFEGFQEDPMDLDLQEAVEKLAQSDLVYKQTPENGEGKINLPFALAGNNFYITRYYNYETQIIEGIKSLISKGQEERQGRLRKLKESSQFEKLIAGRETSKEVGTDWQLLAAAMAFLNNFSIITGGPGTGKTTTVAKILSLLYEENPDLDVKLAAPTGKAAMRMKEALKDNAQVPEDFRESIAALEPFTLHRLLGPKYQSPYFRHDAKNKLQADVIIVDEASMIDVALFAKLISAVKEDTRLIVLGDQNQLASVEAGSLLGDLCNSVKDRNRYSAEVLRDLKELLPFYELQENRDESELLQDHITELQFSYRFQKHPEIGRLSKAIIINNEKELGSFYEKTYSSKEIEIDPEYDQKLLHEFIEGFSEYIEEKDIAEAIRKLNKLRILAVIRRGQQGVEGLNEKAEKHLNRKGLLTTGKTFYKNRPVMVTKNHPDLNLFNGDVGIVRPAEDDPEKMKLWFLDEKGEAKSYPPGLLTDVETVFAMTIHKSQGSEFDSVFMVMPKTEELALLTRELLYTGITRAKQNLKIQGTIEVLKTAAKAMVKRASGVRDRI
ncbi:exodeoxyribonuclease V subunit alpha [Salegentibacter sp. F188]|uniref:RecBCD enzyme subunit RecD n=1 Tax=Autumnicola patrickiae TaxID=3075591 RepID=A0ABU3DYD6_9FLAO|nr:exodeoxyribonuclease V subunit alpha [Salegentibacter sp. F188]MDT0688751.1 exodeoxyribonuclease V subunit alpha [Salegentibacter sp. F188]